MKNKARVLFIFTIGKNLSLYFFLSNIFDAPEKTKSEYIINIKNYELLYAIYSD